MQQITILDVENLNIKTQQYLTTDVKIKQDLISQTATPVYLNKNIKNICLNDIVKIREDRKDYFYIVDKIDLSKSNIYIKDIFNLFQQKVFTPEKPIKEYLEDNYNNNLDPKQNYSWLDFDIPNNIFFITNKKFQDTIDLKTTLKETIIKNQLIFKLEQSYTPHKLIFKLEAQPIETKFLNLLNPCFINKKSPAFSTANNTVDITAQEVENKTITTTDGTTTSVEVIKSTTKKRFFLLEDGSITENQNDPNRILPVSVKPYFKKYKTGSTFDIVEEAKNQLATDTRYNFSFELLNTRKMYQQDFYLGEIIELCEGQKRYKMSLTGIEKNKNTTLFTFGVMRFDMYEKWRNGGAIWQ